jgi:hypothetical protein
VTSVSKPTGKKEICKEALHPLTWLFEEGDRETRVEASRIYSHRGAGPTDTTQLFVL